MQEMGVNVFPRTLHRTETARFTHLETFEQAGGVEVFGSWVVFVEAYLIPRAH